MRASAFQVRDGDGRVLFDVPSGCWFLVAEGWRGTVLRTIARWIY